MHQIAAMPESLFILGFGPAAEAVVAALPQGMPIAATSRSAEKRAALRQRGIEPVPWEKEAILAHARAATHLLAAIPPDRTTGRDPALLLLADLRLTRLAWVGYLSASSVYGDRGGAWVHDFTPPIPSTERGFARLAAESGWWALASRHAAGMAAFRIAGIYGPGRSVVDALKAGTAQRVVKPGQVFNRIHIDDLGRIIAAAMLKGAQGPIVASDLEPAPPQDVIAYAAGLLGVPPPPEVPFAQADLSAMAQSFYAENKRLKPLRLDELGVKLAYPSFREGLAALCRC